MFYNVSNRYQRNNQPNSSYRFENYLNLAWWNCHKVCFILVSLEYFKKSIKNLISWKLKITKQWYKNTGRIWISRTGQYFGMSKYETDFNFSRYFSKKIANMHDSALSHDIACWLHVMELRRNVHSAFNIFEVNVQ